MRLTALLPRWSDYIATFRLLGIASVAATCIAAVELMSSDDSFTEQLWYNTRYFKSGMKSIGLPIHSETPICPVIVGESETAKKLEKRLFEEGLYGRSIVFPTVAKDKARVRIMINANHTQAHLDRLIDSFDRIGRELGLI